MAIRAVTAALQAAAQNDTAGSLVALASPYLNKTIHEMMAGDTAKDKATDLMAHALLSAVEFQVTGKDPLTGAVAGVTGEVTAQILTQAIYNKTPNQLTANEKENISTLSQLAGVLAAALTAKANGASNQNGGGMALAVAETSKRAVENNFSFIETAKNPEYTTGLWVKAQVDEIIKPAEDKAAQVALDQGLPHYISIEGGIYKFGAKLMVNTRNGTIYFAPSMSSIATPLNTSYKAGISAEVAWISNINLITEGGKFLVQTIDAILGGGSWRGLFNSIK
ncbi:VENN motif pre-toxin domain-containing protein [Haemophilus haemolyticus]|uniref:VENN motif pre-toxin domain-containing protein n=1 Tax=Haemophilus haemolyticus TaxID=726 RepID=UPI000E58DC2A|nr:VENN motif pre-toxin domain-containing protein [Haemophilus haemolyticus]MBS6021353.1 VENN motif pre-toxin domain-containing protein [Haemophilus haemolyticus]